MSDCTPIWIGAGPVDDLTVALALARATVSELVTELCERVRGDP